ncbi:hypothetical protein JHK86_006396 [Glycine max]|nr:hypothetical protein JHK86_006396 [Glycine max]
MKLAYEINLLVKHWREAHCEVPGISGGVVLNSIVEEEIRKDFEVLLIHWKEALHKAASILRGKVKIVDKEINILVKRWAEALREAASISGIVVLNSR